MAEHETAASHPPEVEPFIAAETQMREFTWRAVITGTVLGVLFGASSLYLALKTGLTVSASIPVAVISLAMFRTWSKFGGRDSTILENNIMQTAGSAGESIAFGVGVTMPAILILGFDLELTRVLLVGVLGGLLGVLMMIPLRRALIVKEHATLKFPEGTACAAVLKAGASEESRAAASPAAKREMEANLAAGLGVAPGAHVIIAGFIVGLVYKALNVAAKGWKETAEKVFGPPLRNGSVGVEVSPEMLGVGYIIGPKVASTMAAGGVLAFLVLIPLIQFFGDAIETPLAPGTTLIRDMDPYAVRGAYVLYIGAGAVAAGGIISVLRALPTIWRGVRAGLRSVRKTRGGPAVERSGEVPRTDRDLPISFVGIGLVLLLAAITFAPYLEMNLLGAILIVVFGFLFVTVSSRLTGEIGSSSNPVSGMTIATLLLTCLIFLLIGWRSGPYYVTALSVGAIVCIAACNGGTTSQDLKTGHLVGGTPKHQQYAILVGTLVSALVLGSVLLALNEKGTVYVPAAKVAPGLRATPAVLADAKVETLAGPQAAEDARSYRAWHKTDTVGGPAGKYLVNDAGEAVWLVDPGINGEYKERPNGSSVDKYGAPKALLVSYIIKGILDQKLPWALVLLGVFIAIALEMGGIPSLAFAVGVYLPLTTSAPIFLGGLVRWFVDWRQHRKLAATATAAQREAESDKSPGVLAASGLIAGGAIAGIVIALLAVPLESLNASLTKWSQLHNPFVRAESGDALSLIPFALLIGFLLLVAMEKLLVPKRRATGSTSPAKPLNS